MYFTHKYEGLGVFGASPSLELRPLVVALATDEVKVHLRVRQLSARLALEEDGIAVATMRTRLLVGARERWILHQIRLNRRQGTVTRC